MLLWDGCRKSYVRGGISVHGSSMSPLPLVALAPAFITNAANQITQHVALLADTRE